MIDILIVACVGIFAIVYGIIEICEVSKNIKAVKELRDEMEAAIAEMEAEE